MLAAFALLCGATACGPSNGGGAPATYLIVFTIGDTTDDLDALEFTVTYDNGNFTGTGEAVECVLVDEDNEATFDDDNVNKLVVTIDASETALEEEDDIVECEFVATVQPTSNDFTIVVGETDPADAEVDVVVTSTDLVE